MTSDELLVRLGEAAAGARRIAVDGPDAAGKTTLADALAPLLGAARVCADDHLRPPAERYARGPESPEGYYRDSFDDSALRAAVEAAPAPVVVDGVFLQRPDLDDLWDFRIWVDVSPDETLRRAAARDADRFPDVRGRYERRYLPAQRLYLEELDPRARADVVVENEDPARPTLRTVERAASR
jgi:uridine kinase